MAKGCFDVQKGDFCERLELFVAVLLYLDKDMLIRGKCKFLLELPRNIFQKIPKKLLSLRKVYCEIVIA